MIVDDFTATGKKVGDSINILDHPFRICGIVEHGKGGRKFIPIQTMGELTGTPNKASMFYLRTEDTPKYQEEIRQAILATPGMNQYNVATAEEYLSAISPTRLPYMSTAINVVVGIALVIGFLVIFQSMYTAVMERTREIGVLKSLGASRGYIVALVLRETGTICGGRDYPWRSCQLRAQRGTPGALSYPGFCDQSAVGLEGSRDRLCGITAWSGLSGV